MQSEALAQRLHPLTVGIRLLRGIPALLLAVIPLRASLGGATEGLGNIGAFLVFIPMALYGMVVLPLIVAAYLRFSYRITTKEIVIRSGIFRRQKRNIPLERIQNVAIVRTLLPRTMGLATVKIMTAGSDTAEGVLEYTNYRQHGIFGIPYAAGHSPVKRPLLKTLQALKERP